MSTETTDALLRAILSVAARGVFPRDRLAKIVSPKKNPKVLRAYDLCDGTVTQADVAKATKFDDSNLSGVVERWEANGVLVRLGTARSARLLHLYPLGKEVSNGE